MKKKNKTNYEKKTEKCKIQLKGLNVGSYRWRGANSPTPSSCYCTYIDRENASSLFLVARCSFFSPPLALNHLCFCFCCFFAVCILNDPMQLQRPSFQLVVVVAVISRLVAAVAIAVAAIAVNSAQ